MATEPCDHAHAREVEQTVRKWAVKYHHMHNSDSGMCDRRLADGEQRYGRDSRFGDDFDSIRELQEELWDAFNLACTAFANHGDAEGYLRATIEHICEALSSVRGARCAQWLREAVNAADG